MAETFPLAFCVTRARSSTNSLRVGRSGTTSLRAQGTERMPFSGLPLPPDLSIAYMIIW